LELELVALLFALAIGLPLGAVAALRKGTWLDHLSRTVAAMGQAFPGFWVGLMLLLIFGERLRWLPTSGDGGIRHLILPGLTIALPVIPAIVRIFRSSLLGTLKRDYVRTARAKGLSGGRVFRKHVVRNSSALHDDAAFLYLWSPQAITGVGSGVTGWEPAATYIPVTNVQVG
jgi:ABC-type dipeptide/oligopeptide/nickel transport system permease component